MKVDRNLKEKYANLRAWNPYVDPRNRIIFIKWENILCYDKHIA